jgi:hypothetical protein
MLILWSTPESESYVTTDSQSASLSWYKAPIRGLRPDFYFCTEYGIRVTVTFLILRGALSDERTGLSFVCAAGPCQRSLSRVLVPWDLRSYFTVSDLRLPFLSPPTTHRVTVEVFDPASTRVKPNLLLATDSHYADLAQTYRKHVSHVRKCGADHTENTASSVVVKACVPRHCLAMGIHITIYLFYLYYFKMRKVHEFHSILAVMYL